MKSNLLLAAAVILAGTPAAFAQTDMTTNRAWSGSSGSNAATGTLGSSQQQYPAQYAPVERAAPRPQSQREADAMQPNKTIIGRDGDEVGPSPEIDMQNRPATAPGTPSRGTAGSSTMNSTMGSGSAGYGSTGTMSNNQGYTGSTTGSVAGKRQTVTGSTTNSEIQDRRGRGQNELELRQTSLLNQFSGAGYISVRDFRKEGDRYVAQAQDQTGRWASVELDPRTGTITPR